VDRVASYQFLMPAPGTPEDGDLVIRHEQRDGSGVYVLRSASGPDQLLTRSREEAVSKAIAWARREQLRVWWEDDSQCRVLEDFRIGEQV
jgi:hypothetical protein